jgi:hypothetical protein
MYTPSIEDILDRAIIDAVALAEQNYDHLARYGSEVPEYLAPPTEQPGQWAEDGALRKVARVHLAGTDCYVDVHGEEAGWSVRILRTDGETLYECGSGAFDLKAAAATVPAPTEPE